jgi:hypothetical protein
VVSNQPELERPIGMASGWGEQKHGLKEHRRRNFAMSLKCAGVIGQPASPASDGLVSDNQGCDD